MNAKNPTKSDNKNFADAAGITKTGILKRAANKIKPEPEQPFGSKQTAACAGPERLNYGLINAAEKGDTEMVKRAISNGADVNANDKYGVTPLMVAVLKGHTEVARLLIEKGADVNARNKDGVTSLMLASMKGHGEIAKMLAEKGADVNARNKDGETPLILAVYNNNEDVVEVLLKTGADTRAKDHKGMTAFDVAVYNGYGASIALLTHAALLKKTQQAKNERTQ